MSLELTIRPFQSRDVTPPKVVPEGTKRDEPVNVSLGKEGGKVRSTTCPRGQVCVTRDGLRVGEGSRFLDRNEFERAV